MLYLEQSSMNAEEEEKKENERNTQFTLPSFYYFIYIFVQKRKECQLYEHRFNVCSRRSNE